MGKPEIPKSEFPKSEIRGKLTGDFDPSSSSLDVIGNAKGKGCPTLKIDNNTDFAQ